jgi:protein phosphatase
MAEPFPVETGDEFMLCSDGLCDMANDEEIRTTWANAPDVHAAAERLIALAKDRGGNDNITVGIVCFSPDETQVVRKIPVTREIGVQ